jgi:ubiquitin C-terminal hydrolase
MKEKMSMNAAYKMKRYADKLDQKNKEHIAFMSDLLKKHGDLDESGNLQLEYQGEDEDKKPVGYKLKDAEAFKKEMDEYLASEFTIEVNPLFAAELSGVQISPNDLIVLEPFIADLNNL